MPINQVIHDKRKMLGLTQEDIADALGVSVPAVSKWENGISYPDITIIPALARFLHTDLNTLLCYERELSEKEVGEFVNNLAKRMEQDGFVKIYQSARDKIKEYPTDARFIQTTATFLKGAMLMSQLKPEEKSFYDEEITHLYEMVGQLDCEPYAGRAHYMLASNAISEKDYEKAQELLDRIPKYDGLDKRMLQARLLEKKEQYTEAAKIYEGKLSAMLNELQVPLMQLIHIAVMEGNSELAEKLVLCGEQITKAAGLWEYISYVYAFQKAMDEKDAAKTMEVLEPMMKAMLIPWDVKKSPLMSHMTMAQEERDKNLSKEELQQRSGHINMGQKMLSGILADLEHNPEYDFLKGENAFQELINEYKKKL